MGLNYGDTFEEFESMLDSLINEKYILDGLASYGLLPQRLFAIKDIKFLTNKKIKTNLTDKNIHGKEFNDIQTSYSNNLVKNKDSLFKNPVRNTRISISKDTSLAA